MDKAHNRKTSRILCILIVIALTIGVFTSVSATGIFAHAEDDPTFSMTQINPTNNQFLNTTGSSTDGVPQPDGWTGAGVGGLGVSNKTSGVMDLSTYASNKDKYDLEKYFPGSASPDSPFGPNSKFDGTNRNVLLINITGTDNTTSQGTAYGYTSGSLTFTANRFYMVKAWVSTSDFLPESGAAIRVNGLDENIVLDEINTAGTTANKGWAEYTIYVATSAYADKTVTISLQVGDNYENDFRPASGYAMFDNVTAYEIAPADFYAANDSARTKVYDLSNKTSDKFAHLENLDFTSDVPDSSNWQRVSAGTGLSQGTVGTYNGAMEFSENNRFHLTSDPLSANGKYENGDSDILVISSYAQNQFNEVAMGVASQTFTVERYRYYRVSAWIKQQEVSGGSGASLAISAVRDADPTVGRYEGKNLFSSVTSCEGDTSNRARGGFKQYSLYVKGSALRDYQASVECWLGNPGSGNKSRGIAIFDNVTVEEISPADYNSYNANGTSVDFDTAAGMDGNAFVSIPDTGISNGGFWQIDNYEEFGYPLSPSGWTKYTPSDVGTTDYSNNESKMDTAAVINGIVPTDDATFTQYADKFGAAAVNPVNYSETELDNVLMLYSARPVAVCYRSPAFTVTADKPGMLTVSLVTDAMGNNDYGASLVLKSSSRILSTIEGIKTKTFKTYTFYIEPGSADLSDLSVEIWLGNIDRDKNETKLSAGRVYVSKVSYAAISDDTAEDGTTVTKSASAKFAEYKDAYDNNRKLGIATAQAAYSFKSLDFSAYDSYDKAELKYPYNWQVSTGGTYAGQVRYGVDPQGMMVLNNPAAAASSVTYVNSINLTASTRYRIDVAIRVNIHDNQERKNAVGATVALTGSSEVAFSDIKDTARHSGDIVDNTAFRTYSFYINNGDADSSVSLKISLGENSFNKQCSGTVTIQSITFTDITQEAYDIAVAETAKRDDDKDYDEAYKDSVISDLSTTSADDGDADTDKGSTSLDWWLIPSILFAIAILIALVGFMIRKIMEKRSAKKGVTQKRVSYDRAATLNLEHNKNADEENKVSATVDNDEHYESFDDDVATNQQASQEKSLSEVAPESEQTTEENGPSETAETENADANTDLNDGGDSTPTAEPAAEKPKAQPEKPAQTDGSFVDRFDD